MSPRCFGKVMTGGPVRSTGAQDMVPSCPAPAAVPEQRRRSTLEFHRFQRRADSQRMSPERRRLTYALLLSLLIHTLLLSLTFGGQGLWLPGFGFPWQDRRIEVPDLRVVVVPAQVTAAEPAVAPVAEPLQQAWVEQPVASGPALTPSVSRAPTPRRTAAAIVPEANPRAEANPRTDAATGAAPAQMPLRADRPGDTAPPPIPAPAVIALARTDEATWVVPATPAMPTPVIAAAPSASSPETAMPSLRDAGDAARARIDQEAGERAVELAKLDPSKQEGQRQAEQLEAARQDAARQEAARAENARLEAERQEAARQEAATRKRRHDRRRHGRRRQRTGGRTARPTQEAARQEASDAHGGGTAGSRTAGGRTAGGRTGRGRTAGGRTAGGRTEEAARARTRHVRRPHGRRPHGSGGRTQSRPRRVEAAHGRRPHGRRPHGRRPHGRRPHGRRPHGRRPHELEAARVEVAQEAAARREAALRAIGRQLDEEAARREAATAAARLSPSLDPRRAAHVDTGSSVALTPTRNSSCTRKPGPGRSS